MRSIELFTGGGGLALGTHRAGFHHLAVVELDTNACDTLEANSDRGVEGIDWNVVRTDIHEFKHDDYPSDIDLLAGGAPCQPFSLGGKHAGEADSRNLFPQVFKAVRLLRPKAFLLENVKGLTRASFLLYFDYIILQLRFPHVEHHHDEGWEEHKARLERFAADHEDLKEPEACYHVQWRVVDVADYGVPQRRHRVFIVGFREDLDVHWSFPAPTHSQDALLHAQYVTGSYWNEYGLDRRPAPSRFARQVERLTAGPPAKLERWRTVRDAIRDLPEPVEWEPYPAHDNHVGIPGARAYPGHTGSPWDWPAKTIKAGDHGNPGGENMLADDNGSVRYFTVRELARIQTFPDDWHFKGPWGESRRQLGNAVPVRMAEILGRSIHESLVAVISSSARERDELLTSVAD